MNKYFYVWLLSGVLYALGITTMIITQGRSVLSAGFISNEIFQISALLCVFYACNLIDNIPHNFFALKYAAIIVIFLVVYGLAYTIDQTIYIVMLIIKLFAVVMTIYTITVKWRFHLLTKALSVILLTASGMYLSLYDFLVYGDAAQKTDETVHICIGILFLVLQNINFAALYRMQSRSQEKMRGDYLTSFAENSADIIFYYTLQPYPRFAFVSPASETLLGYSPQAFYSNSKLHIELAVEEDRQQMELLFGGFPGDSHQCIVRAERKDGETVHLECYATKVKVNGRAAAVEGVLRDITERVAAERKVVENNRSRQLMLSYISHDLKTPITYILAYSEAIQKNVIKSEKDKMAAVESIHSKADALAKLVEDISLLSKLEASRFNYSFEAMGCRELAEHLKELHMNDFDEQDRKYGAWNRQYRFEIDSAIDEAAVLVDVKRIEQVFENLLSNAIKVTDDGGSINVFCGLDMRKGHFCFSVCDNGLGIAKEDLPHIFENFYRSPQTKRRNDGSGLGLSLSKQIALGHGGAIAVESELGKGSKFLVRIPLFEE